MPRPLSGRAEQILTAAQTLLPVHGVTGLTFDVVATELGVTKQAIIYWFRTKESLLGELHLRALRAESEALIEAVRGRTPTEAIHAMMQTMLEHHAATAWEEFRLLYMTVQLVPPTRSLLTPQDRAERVYPVTAAFYDAFEEALRTALGEHARDSAVAMHLAAIGLVTMSGLMSAIDDDMRTPIPELADLLAERLVAGLPSGTA